MKKLLAILLILAMGLSSVACSAKPVVPAENSVTPPAETQTPAASAEPAKEEAKKLHIGLSSLNLANVFWSTFQQAIEAKCAELGYEITVHDGKGDVSLQVNAIENWVTQGVDAIIVAPVDATALQPAVNMALEAGIPVVNVDATLEKSTSYIGVAQYDYGYHAGKLAAEWINENLADEETVEVCIFDKPSSLNIIQRANGIAAGLTENSSNAVVVSYQPATTADTGMTAAETVLQAYPGIDCFIGVNDTGILGAYEALVASGKDTSKMCLVGLDATSEALKLISQDTCFRASVDISTTQYAQDALQLAVDATNGIVDQVVKVNMTPVTIENVADFMK